MSEAELPSADILSERKRLKALVDGPTALQRPLFLLQQSNESVHCSQQGCEYEITPGEYRLLEWNGECYDSREPGGTKYYHVACFERLLDFSSAQWPVRIECCPRYTPDKGARWILEEYKAQWRERLVKGENLAHVDTNGGSRQAVIVPCDEGARLANAWYADVVVQMAGHDFEAAQGQEDIFDGARDETTIAEQEEVELWDIRDYFGKGVVSYSRRHILSAALDCWDFHMMIATTNMDSLDEEQSEGRELLGRVNVERIRHFCAESG